MVTLGQKIFRDIHEYIVGILFLVLVFVTSLGVFFRYVLNDPLSWSEELARYLLVWMTLFGATVGVKRGIHISIGMNLFSHFPMRIAMLGKILVNVLIIGFLLVMTYKGIQLCLVVHGYLSPVLQISMGYIWSVVPLTGSMMLFYLCRFTLADIRDMVRR